MNYLHDIRDALAAGGHFQAVEIVIDHSLAVRRAAELAADAEDPATWSCVFLAETEESLQHDITVDVIIAVSALDDAGGAAARERQKAARAAVRTAVHFQDFGAPDDYFEPAHYVGGHLMGLDGNGIAFWNEQYQLKSYYRED